MRSYYLLYVRVVLLLRIPLCSSARRGQAKRQLPPLQMRPSKSLLPSLVALSPLLSKAVYVSAYHVPPTRQDPVGDPAASEAETLRVPTSQESAVLARRILRLQSIGTMSTVFQRASAVGGAEDDDDDDDDGSSGNSGSSGGSNGVPTTEAWASAANSAVEGAPLGLMDYYADCEADTGNPTVLTVAIGTTFRNVAAGSNISLSTRWHPHYPDDRPYSAASLPRFSLIGYLEDMSPAEVERYDVEVCFARRHPDAVLWYPGNRIRHPSRWTRLVVTNVFWLGGFGDVAYLGWIPLDEWRNVTSADIERVRLPGERKRHEPSFEL